MEKPEIIPETENSIFFNKSGNNEATQLVAKEDKDGGFLKNQFVHYSENGADKKPREYTKVDLLLELSLGQYKKKNKYLKYSLILYILFYFIFYLKLLLIIFF